MAILSWVLMGLGAIAGIYIALGIGAAVVGAIKGSRTPIDSLHGTGKLFPEDHEPGEAEDWPTR